MDSIIAIVKSSIRRVLHDLTHMLDDDSTRIHLTPKKTFKINDLVETTTGERGRVWQTYSSITTGEVLYCSVIWDSLYKGQKMSLLLPVEDKGREFNPIIRLVHDY